MDKVDFDEFADNYDDLLQKQLSFFDKHDYFAEYKINLTKSHLLRSPKKILEYGCGTGRNLKYLKEAFPQAEIYAADISNESLKIAEKENSDVTLFSLNEEFSFNNFDLIFVAGVFHHIDPKLKKNTAKLINKLLTSGGELFVFEHNPYNPVTRHMVNTCEFDMDAELLKPKELKKLLETSNFTMLKLKYTLFIPGMLRKLRFLERYLWFVPLGGQYFIHAAKK